MCLFKQHVVDKFNFFTKTLDRNKINDVFAQFITGHEKAKVPNGVATNFLV